MLIGKLSEQVGLSRDTIRFYEKSNFIQSITRNNGYRDYPEFTVQQLELIKVAKSLGFSLAEIKQVSDLLAQGEISSENLKELIAKKLTIIDEKIQHLQHIRQLLQNIPAVECPLRQGCRVELLTT